MLLAGDFNCVLNATDSTGQTQPSRALSPSGAALTSGTGGMNPDQVSDTRITQQNRRPDRRKNYVTRKLFERKEGA